MGVVYKPRTHRWPVRRASSSFPRMSRKTAGARAIPARGAGRFRLNHPISAHLRNRRARRQTLHRMEFLDGLTMKHRIAGRPLETESPCLSHRNCRRSRRRPQRRHYSSRHQAGQHFRHQAGHAKILDFGLAKLTQRLQGRCSGIEATAGVSVENLTSPGWRWGRCLHVAGAGQGKELDAHRPVFLWCRVV